MKKAAIALLSTIALLVAAPILAQGDGVANSATGSGHLRLGGELRTFSLQRHRTERRQRDRPGAYLKLG